MTLDYPSATCGSRSDDPAVVLVAAEYVRHDIAMQVLVERIGADALDAFWHVDPALVPLQHGRGAARLPARRSSEARRND